MKPTSFGSRYTNRGEAGRVLASHLSDLADRTDVVVLALPRGGVPVGFEVAEALRAPLDVFVVRKLGLPAHPELAMGAIASGNVRVFNDDVLAYYRPSDRDIEDVTSRERAELLRREQTYRGAGTLTPLAGRIVIVVDDGLATGATMRAAVQAVAQHSPARIIVAVPVGARETCESLRRGAEVVCPLTPDPLEAVGLWYENFDQLSDDDVRALLHAPRTRPAPAATAPPAV